MPIDPYEAVLLLFLVPLFIKDIGTVLQITTGLVTATFYY